MYTLYVHLRQINLTDVQCFQTISSEVRFYWFYNLQRSEKTRKTKFLVERSTCSILLWPPRKSNDDSTLRELFPELTFRLVRKSRVKLGSDPRQKRNCFSLQFFSDCPCLRNIFTFPLYNIGSVHVLSLTRFYSKSLSIRESL